MNIAVTGSRGMLGSDLVALLRDKGHDVLECDLHNCNILDYEQLEHLMTPYRPDVIIHTAAYTNVDQAETDEDGAMRLNVEGTANVAEIARACGAKMVYVSTDYVFDGSKSAPYLETDSPHPLGVYGRTKLLGEEQVREALNHQARQDFLIVRTAWLYGHHGKNFVSAILQRAREHGALRVVNDQTGGPTYTKDLAWGIRQLIEHQASGIVHVTNSGQCTWYDFAKNILEEANIPNIKIEPIETAQLQRLAPRPQFSVLDTARFTSCTGQPLRHWQEGLRTYFAEAPDNR